MTRYKSARRIAAIFTVLGWILLGLSLLLFVGGAVLTLIPSGGPATLIHPTFATFLMPTIVGSTFSLLIVLAGHVARAVFDIADASEPPPDA